MNYDPDKNKQTKYKVKLALTAPMRQTTNIEMTMPQEELDKTIGRYTRKYGPPVNMSAGGSEVTLLEFYCKLSSGTFEAVITYENFYSSTGNKTEDKTVVPPPPPAKSVVHPEPIKSLLDSELITQCNEYGY